MLVQAAWAAVRSKNGGKFKGMFEYMTIEKSKGKKKAIVAIARRIAELLYVLMRDETGYAARPFIPPEKKKEAEEKAQLLCA